MRICSMITANAQFWILLVITITTIASDKSDEVLQRNPRRYGYPNFLIGAVLDDQDSGTDIAMYTGLRAVAQKFQNITTINIIKIPKTHFVNATTSVCDLLKRGVVALVSPLDPLIRQSVRMVAKKFHIPLIETHWDTDRSNSRYAINVHPSHDAFGEAVFDYLNFYRWNHVVLILSDYGNIVKHTAWLNKFGGTLSIRTLGPDKLKWKPIISELATTDSRNFLLDIPYWYTKDFLVLAYLHNMTGEQYNYVFSDWDTHLLDLSPFKIDDGASISTFSIVPGAGQYKRYGRGSFVEALIPEIYKRERARRYSDILPALPAFAALTYDAMLLLGVALLNLSESISVNPGSLTCDSGPQAFWADGEKLIRYIKSNISNIPTLTGGIHFDEQGYRSNFNMSILSLQDGGMYQIGYWTLRDELQITRPIKRKKKVVKKPLESVSFRVATVPDTPFVIQKKSDAYGRPLKTPDAWDGYCVDLLNLIAADVGFNYTIEITDKFYGSRLTNSTTNESYYDGIVGIVHRKEADIALAALTITYEREMVLDFTTPFMTLGGSLLFMRPKSQKPSIFSFLQPLSPTVWAYVITTYIVVSVGLFLVARLSPYEWQNPHPCEAFSEEKENQFTVLSSFWFFITPLLNQGTEMAPHTISTRLLTGIWWFFALILISTYTANLAAFLTVDTTELPIESVEDLVAQTKIKYGTLRSGSSRDFFKNSKIPVFQQMWQFMSAHEDVFVQNTQAGIDRVLQGDYVFIMESSWNEYYNKRDCRLMQVGRLLDTKGYGIGLQEGSKYRDAISESILKLQKAQTLDQLKRKWLSEYNITEPCTDTKDSSKEAKPLGIEQVGGVFVLLVIGFFWAFIVSVIEFCVHNKACTKSQGDLFAEMWKELRFAMRCMTPSTRAKPTTPVMHEPPQTSNSLGFGESPETLGCTVDRDQLNPAPVQSQNLLAVPVTDSNEALLSSSGDTNSSGDSSVNESYPPLPLPQPNSSSASPWSHYNNSQRKPQSEGENWWRISQSAV